MNDHEQNRAAAGSGAPGPAGNAAAPGAPPPADPNAVPRDTSPTWQSELLLSGGVVFALFQLPPLIDAGMAYFRPRVGEGGLQLLIFLFLYGKVVVLALIVAFTLHLALRAVWIALVGLHSVFPNGVDWSRIRSGPHGLAASQRNHVPLPRLIDRTDNVSTMVFGLGALVAMMGASIGAMTLLLVGLASMVRLLVGPGISIDTTLFALMGLLLGPLMLAQVVDRLFGHRIPAGSLPARMISGLVSVTSRFAMGRTATSMLMTFVSNVGQRKGMVLVMGSMYALLVFAAIERAVDNGALRLANEAYLPREGKGGALDPRHYADQRGENWRYSVAPFIPSMVARGAYLPLFIPYDPEALPPRLAATCPELPRDRVTAGEDEMATDAARREAERVSALVACMAALYSVQLDGNPVVEDMMRIHTDPSSGLRGLLVVIPIHDLARGTHALTLDRLPAYDEPAPAADAPPERDQITFWR
jgi:hypothetical protein